MLCNGLPSRVWPWALKEPRANTYRRSGRGWELCSKNRRGCVNWLGEGCGKTTSWDLLVISSEAKEKSLIFTLFSSRKICQNQSEMNKSGFAVKTEDMEVIDLTSETSEDENRQDRSVTSSKPKKSRKSKRSRSITTQESNIREILGKTRRNLSG